MHRIAVIAVLVVSSLSTLVARQVKPTFEVASVKPQLAPMLAENIVTGFPRVLPGGVFSPTHATVAALILFAYDLRPYQLVGAPEWVQREPFHIDARAVSDASEEQMKLMVQSLLEDRFKLVVHRERRDMRFEALVLARPDRSLGPHVYKVDACTAATVKQVRQQLPVRPYWRGGASSSGCTPTGFQGFAANGLSTILGVPVVDATEVAGPLFFELRYASLLVQPGAEPESDPSYPPFHVALQEQLGLKLEPRKGTIEVLVIDSVQQPTEN